MRKSCIVSIDEDNGILTVMTMNGMLRYEIVAVQDMCKFYGLECENINNDKLKIRGKEIYVICVVSHFINLFNT